MKRLLIPLAASLFVAAASQAAGIFKCTTESGVVYQAEACVGGATEVVTKRPSARTETRQDEEAAVAGEPVPRGAVTIHPGGGKLQVGASDLLVLNNRDWGRPQRITRNRASGAWHEHWDYATRANGGKQLHFVNGRLAGIEDLDPPAPAVSMAPVAMTDDHQPREVSFNLETAFDRQPR